MSRNRAQHLLVVLTEDDANKEIVNGFEYALSDAARGKIYVPPPAGGWKAVIERFKSEIVKMRKYPLLHVLLVLDFDDEGVRRLNVVKENIPADLVSRAFVLGCKTEPEQLKKMLKSNFQEIGEVLAKDCHENSFTTWNDPHLKDNQGELSRLKETVRPFLFESWRNPSGLN